MVVGLCRETTMITRDATMVGLEICTSHRITSLVAYSEIMGNCSSYMSLLNPEQGGAASLS